ncbi:TRAF-interacting protein with FHA domain-containing protein A-like [Erpetoichthys calabaricus]|uniref:TRAF-interacting protein with FHA domain-containing protein A-like n=1 Tax=Erpetoichthys calabaricus TaxID=27687 RepID=UPI002233F064|nr:TRAF-interacting protein with FHA domain-containing protein A-like [Erpetoichthys calabaricus]XP_051785803.1 TRAF-interacting protein with FHA domain-containing protein A-like [Erpetoichthys calabaricus]
MSALDDLETEEVLPCIRLKAYHPYHEIKNVFQFLHFNKKMKHRADEALKVGRDSKMCDIQLHDLRVSRMQFAIEAFRYFNSSELSFEIKNLSQKGRLTVNNAELEYLNKVELPRKAIVRFAEFVFLVEKEDGESTDYFETVFELAALPPSLELICCSSLSPVPETGLAFPVAPNSAVELAEGEF